MEDFDSVVKMLESLPRMQYAEVIGNAKAIAELVQVAASLSANMKALESLNSELHQKVQNKLNLVMDTLTRVVSK